MVHPDAAHQFTRADSDLGTLDGSCGSTATSIRKARLSPPRLYFPPTFEPFEPLQRIKSSLAPLKTININNFLEPHVVPTGARVREDRRRPALVIPHRDSASTPTDQRTHKLKDQSAFDPTPPSRFFGPRRAFYRRFLVFTIYLVEALPFHQFFRSLLLPRH